MLLGALLLAVGLVGVSGWRQADRSPADGSAEAGFARDMSTHHGQAVEMALRVRDRTDDPRIAQLALDILLTQQGQIGRMSGWLDAWGLPQTGAERPMAWMGHSVEGRMPGMASPAEIAALASLPSAEADREFLRLMIRHHDGGVPMAQAILERSDNDAVRALATAIVVSQRAEIATMQQLLETISPVAPPAG